MSRTLRLAVVLLSLFSATFILKASLPQVSTGVWQAAGSLATARSGAAAVALPDGRVLVTGGQTTGGGITNSAETYDPQTNAWQMLSATMVEARAGHSISQ